MHYLGDFPTGKTIAFPFATYNAAGASVTLTGLAVTDIECYKLPSMTQRSSDAGYALIDTDGIDLDGVTGIHGFTIDTADNTDAGFYAAGNDYTVVVSAVTVDAQTVNFIAGRFSIDNRQLLRPTTASRTLDVSTGGEAGLDWANIGSPTTAQNLSGTNIDVDQVVASVSGAVATVTALAANSVNASALAADAAAEIADAVWDEDATGHQTTGTFGQAIGDPVADTNTIYKAVVTDAAGATVGVDVVAVKADTAAILVDTGTTLDARIPAALVSGRIDASVGAMAANVMTAAAAASDLTTELQNGLATAAALDVVDNFLDTEIAAILAAVDTEIGTLTTNLATVDGIVDDIKQMIGHKTTIATLASQTSFTLTAGSADNDAYNGWGCFVVDASTATQIALGIVSDYTGSTKTITLLTDPAVFTMATTDIVILLPAKITDGVALTAAGVDAILDEIVEGSVTLRQSVRLWNSAMGAKASGLATTTAVYRDLGDTKNRITGTVDASGNRSAVTLDLT